MSIASKIFNRTNTKLIAALSIPMGMAWIFWYSQRTADIEYREFEKSQKENPIADRVVVSNYEIKEVDASNVVKWRLVAKKGSTDEAGITHLEDVDVSYYEDGTGAVKVRLIAPSGEAEQSTHYVKLTSSNGKRVNCQGDSGKLTLTADTVELTKKNQFTASGGVTIVFDGVAKVTGNQADGKLDAGGVKDFIIRGNTHAVIAM